MEAKHARAIDITAPLPQYPGSNEQAFGEFKFTLVIPISLENILKRMIIDADEHAGTLASMSIEHYGLCAGR